jgi:hypothetical protein
VDQLCGLGWVSQPELLLMLVLDLLWLAAASCSCYSRIKPLLLRLVLLGGSNLCLPHHVLPVGAADGAD